jgi:serine/threonine protein kinase
MPRLIRKLKGGSLNSTVLYEDNRGLFVRKLISIQADREYGYVRWYSQLKKLQRFSQLIPQHVPQVLDAGVCEQGAYFDIEYIDAKDVKTLFKDNLLDATQTEQMHNQLWQAFDKLHQHTYKPNLSSLRLYFQEEVLQKINDARRFPEFEAFYQLDKYVHWGETVEGIKNKLDYVSKLFDQDIVTEGYVHGNPTLENILYSEKEGIVFIDLYEEGIVDSKFMDYSQVLQCSSSYYGMLNDGVIGVEGSTTHFDAKFPKNLLYFDQLFNEELDRRCTEQEYLLVRLFEATQFFRMLPFKCHSGNIEAAKFFYSHACALVNKLL